MKNTGIKSKRRITSIITIILTVMMLSGCINNTRQINVGVPKGAETNDFLTAVNRDLDPDVIKYDGIRPTVNNKTKEVDHDYNMQILKELDIDLSEKDLITHIKNSKKDLILKMGSNISQ